ncbi:MAG: Nif-specific regulatory protein [bacterium]|jgi:Nif-specific regulatory protein
MYVDFILQATRMLTSSGDLIRNINVLLTQLYEYFSIRNATLIFRDSVTSRYFIELSPELSEEERAKWNQTVADNRVVKTIQFQHELLLYREEAEYLGLPCPEEIKDKYIAMVVQPIVGQERGLALGVIIGYLMDRDDFQEKVKMLKITAGLIAMSMGAAGYSSPKIYETPLSERFPTVLDGIIGNSPSIKAVADIVRKIATSKATVLIRGESGTGKELIARAIHNNSIVHNAPFIGINCAALSDNLLESELFGHEKGSFTGAISARIGRFEAAHGGTLFLDEIGDTSLSFQAKLLRVLQEGEFERLGSNKTIRVDVRIVCATNINIEEAIRTGSFREDLFYRLNVVVVRLPPLRERKNDIIHLVRYFLLKLNEKYGKTVQVRPQDLEMLQRFSWQGNIRQLENVIHSSFLMENNGVLDFTQSLDGVDRDVSKFTMLANDPVSTKPQQEVVESEEIQAIEEALRESKGVQVRAAEILGISLRQLRYRIKKYNLVVRKIGNF